MRDGTHAFFQIQGIFHFFRAFKTEILHIYSLIGQILKQLCPAVSVRGIIVNYIVYISQFNMNKKVEVRIRTIVITIYTVLSLACEFKVILFLKSGIWSTCKPAPCCICLELFLHLTKARYQLQS